MSLVIPIGRSTCDLGETRGSSSAPVYSTVLGIGFLIVTASTRARDIHVGQRSNSFAVQGQGI
jgi:hypothetical protein